MKNMELSILINSLKAQVSVLEAKMKDIHKVAKPKKLADFYGIFAGFGETSEDEIKAVEFKLIVYPLDEEVVSRIPTVLDIHDAIIVATFRKIERR